MFTHLPNGQNIDYNYLINFDMQENSKYSFSETDSTIPFKNTFPRIGKFNACFAYFSMHFCNVYQSIFLLPKTDYRISRLQIESAKVALNFESSNNRHNLMRYCIVTWTKKNTNLHIGTEKIFSDVIYTAEFVFSPESISLCLFLFIQYAILKTFTCSPVFFIAQMHTQYTLGTRSAHAKQLLFISFAMRIVDFFLEN